MVTERKAFWQASQMAGSSPGSHAPPAIQQHLRSSPPTTAFTPAIPPPPIVRQPCRSSEPPVSTWAASSMSVTFATTPSARSSPSLSPKGTPHLLCAASIASQFHRPQLQCSPGLSVQASSALHHPQHFPAPACPRPGPARAYPDARLHSLHPVQEQMYNGWQG